jgi:hypothetical protein
MNSRNVQMREEGPEENREADAALDAILGVWASRHALSAARSEAIRAQIVEAPPREASIPHFDPAGRDDVSVEWWRAFGDSLAGVLRQVSGNWAGPASPMAYCLPAAAFRDGAKEASARAFLH